MVFRSTGWGLFHDWYDSNLHEQPLRVDGVTQRDVIAVDPTYPFGGGTGTLLPASRIQAAASAHLRQRDVSARRA